MVDIDDLMQFAEVLDDFNISFEDLNLAEQDILDLDIDDIQDFLDQIEAFVQENAEDKEIELYLAQLEDEEEGEEF